jgi:antitoxin (DNA-binding transcriptional repressor) of toxin-antitoxin stability system
MLGMRSVGLKLLKNKLSEYVRLAAGGETVLVTDRDSVVAEIVPPQSGRSPFSPMPCWPKQCVRDG